MEKEILKKDSSVNYFHLNIKNSINNKNNYNSKIIISILIFLIGFLLLIIFFISFLYFKIKKKLKFCYESIENIEAIIQNTANNSIIKNEIPNYLEKKLKELQNTSIEWPLSKEIKFRPFMQEEELKAFLSFMRPNMVYFEFGSGGSTNVASYYKLKVYSVESDVLWHNKLKNNNINATYLTVDLKTNEWGFPGKDTTVEDWKKYFQAYQSKYEADIIFIDGRFRVICGLDIFPKIKNDTLVLVHDYDRNIYHILENYYIKVGSWGNLYAFFKNPNITSIPQNIYNNYMYIKNI
jgi:hypothetical protein